MQGQDLEDYVEESTRSFMPRATPSTRFARSLGQDIHRAARQKIGYGPGVPFEEMVVELRKLVLLLRKTLVPIRPQTSFSQVLGSRLQVSAAEQITTRQRLMRWLMVGGVVGSVLSLLGLVTALVLRRRNGRMHTEKPVGIA